jgi:two-component system chemotaxis sensor kinase CheA
MSGHDPELLQPFLVEARDLLGRAGGDLARLSTAPHDADALDSLFRAVHTLKGSTGLFELPLLTRLLHAAEAALESARGVRRLDASAAADLARVADATEAWVDALEGGGEPDGRTLAATRDLIARLEGQAAATSAPDGGEAPAWALAVARRAGATTGGVAFRYRPDPEAYFRGDDPLAIVRAVPQVRGLAITAPAAEDPAAYDPFRCTLQIEGLAEATSDAVRAALRLVADQVELAVVTAAAPAAASGLRLRSLHVDTGRLDAVAALVDELVIARNALAHQTRRLVDATAGAPGLMRDLIGREAALDRVVGDLHAAVTGLRLTPLGPLFARFARPVREIADGLGKAVDLRLAGEDVALDKSIAEGLFEPLLHLLRNAIDHGVEAPAARRAAGKAERAVIRVSAHARGGEVVVEVADDGAGLDLGAIRAAATARGVVAADVAAAMEDEEAAELVFASGFSTAESVSDISGRGVGMDAVRAAVARLGGQVSLENRPGQGLTVRLLLPAQLVLQKVLVVRAGAERFGVPLDAIQETHRVRRDEVTAVREGRAYVRRDAVAPLLRLRDMLGEPGGDDAEAFPVLAVVADGERIGIQVDAIGERLEAPMRPLGGLMAAYPGVLGTVLEGDGHVLLVLDLAELAA